MDTSHGSNLSGVDWGDLKKRTPKYGPSLMEVDWGGKLRPTTKVNACYLKLIGELMKPYMWMHAL